MVIRGYVKDTETLRVSIRTVRFSAVRFETDSVAAVFASVPNATQNFSADVDSSDLIAQLSYDKPCCCCCLANEQPATTMAKGPPQLLWSISACEGEPASLAAAIACSALWLMASPTQASQAPLPLAQQAQRLPLRSAASAARLNPVRWQSTALPVCWPTRPAVVAVVFIALRTVRLCSVREEEVFRIQSVMAVLVRLTFPVDVQPEFSLHQSRHHSLSARCGL